MGADVDWTVTPRPVYHADGRKVAGLLHRPPALHDELTGALGTFPLFSYWGPRRRSPRRRWIVEAPRKIMREQRPDLTLVYVPHLDYDLQRFGPDSPRPTAAAGTWTRRWRRCSTTRRTRGTVVALSEYGISRRPAGRHQPGAAQEGLLEVYTQAGMEYLDPWTSRAFAVADHQIAHVYVRTPPTWPPWRSSARRAGRRRGAGRGRQGRARPRPRRAGELVLVAEPDAWFTYYYWLDDARAPDFARGVEIHRKPGYDPAELFFDPADRAAKAPGRGRPAPQEARHALPDERGRPGPGAGRCAARTAGCRPRPTGRCCSAPSRDCRSGTTPATWCPPRGSATWYCRRPGSGRVRQGSARRWARRDHDAAAPRSRRWCCSTRRVRRSASMDKARGARRRHSRCTSRSPATAFERRAGGCC